MKVNGHTENKMVRENTTYLMDQSKLEFGRMENESSG